MTNTWKGNNEWIGPQERTKLKKLNRWNKKLEKSVRMSKKEFTVVSVYINKMKTTFLFKVWFLTSFFQITSLQVIKREAVNWQLFFVSMFICIQSMLFESLIVIKIESRLHYIDLYDDDECSRLIKWRGIKEKIWERECK